MSFSMIAAIGKNNELGKKNDLIWHLPNDLQYFRNVTMGKTIIMGRKTFESLPKMLPHRHHIVISRNYVFNPEVEIFRDVNELIKKYEDSPNELFVIGGASIYQLLFPYANKLYLTEIEDECKDAQVYFPIFNKDEWDKEIVGENEDDGIKYKHVLYKRKQM